MASYIQPHDECHSQHHVMQDMDLPFALLHGEASPVPEVRAAWMLGQSLSKHHLDHKVLSEFLSQVANIVYPSRLGETSLIDFSRDLGPNPTAPFSIYLSRPLTAYLALDRGLCWLVSTTAILLEYYGDFSYIAQYIFNFIAKMRVTQTNGQVTQYTVSDDHNSSQITSIVAKVVSVIWHEFTNTGYRAVKLPQVLQDVCQTGHHSNPTNFAIITTTILKNQSSHMVLRSNHLLIDVVLWLLTHFDGRIVVIVENKITYETQLHTINRQLDVVVESSCSVSECQIKSESYQITRQTETGDELLINRTFQGCQTQLRQTCRQSLHKDSLLSQDTSIFKYLDSYALIMLTARTLLTWILSRQLYSRANNGSSSIMFFADVSGPTESGQSTISTLLFKIPSIKPVPPIMWPTQTGIYNRQAPGANVEWLSARQIDLCKNLESLVCYFPLLGYLLGHLRQSCTCEHCVSLKDDATRIPTNPGNDCLALEGLKHVLILLAQAVAEGFGCEKFAEVQLGTEKCHGMSILLLDLVTQYRVSWRIWFSVAASVHLGCPFPDDINYFDLIGELAAIQYGHDFAQAPWLDLSQELSIEKSFRMVSSRGLNGLYIPGHACCFDGAGSTFALFETVRTESGEPVQPRAAPGTLAGRLFTNGGDPFRFSFDLKRVNAWCYQLKLTVQTPNFSRVIDPSHTMYSLISGLPVTKCNHENPYRDQIIPEHSRLSSFDQIVGTWPFNPERLAGPTRVRNPIARPYLHMTPLLRNHGQFNTVLAILAPTTKVQTNPFTACVQCSETHAEVVNTTRSRVPPMTSFKDHRYIVNVGENTQEGGWVENHLDPSVSLNNPSSSKDTSSINNSPNAKNDSGKMPRWISVNFSAEATGY